MKKIIILLALLTIAGCSTKFAYRNADWLTYWYVDDYISLTDEQEEHFDEHLQQWLSWHKSEELDKYVAQLNEIKADVETGNISAQRIESLQNKMRSHWVRLRDKLTPDLVTMAPMLTQEQALELFAQLAESELDSKEKRDKRSAKKRKKRWLKNRENNLQRWLGNLSDEQENMIVTLYDKQMTTAELWYQYRIDYQAQLKALFMQPNRDKEFEARLLNLLSEPEQLRSAELKQRIAHNRQHDYQFLADIFSTMSDKQRRHLVEELEDLIDDLTSLKK
ncbi:hypothetical protein PSECIP111951_03958 [Pseudoalteromonas holothuriae]|uniref:Lipoprotein n=1 Tax=Pseudoalteromonas holothuriae TaxID=2963714 RepID=A0ABM9GNK4_9GAMM|nr:DUF6279 family lipoprotein [Pseudoalteromonas sp. CIP111951]CAH9067976.1 hypothetical protein PSECIP111951_03958 [Pseudoalteromonas sp. CIP111951]